MHSWLAVSEAVLCWIFLELTVANAVGIVLGEPLATMEDMRYAAPVLPGVPGPFKNRKNCHEGCR